MSRFVGQRVIVTGAGSGIGQAMVRAFLAEGAQVTGADLDTTGVPDGALAVPADIRSAAQVRELVDRHLREFGGLDVLCNNAGRGSTTALLDCSVDEWDDVFAVNVRGVFLGIQAALPHLLAQGHGVIINTASVAGLVGLPDRPAYCASKGAVIALTRQVAIQLAGTGIRCNSICPGTVASPWVDRLLAEAPDPVQRRAELERRQPMGRLGTPDEVAQAALYLASPAAAFVTGTELVIDGGLRAG